MPEHNLVNFAHNQITKAMATMIEFDCPYAMVKQLFKIENDAEAFKQMFSAYQEYQILGNKGDI